jgi:hypothetical protein
LRLGLGAPFKAVDGPRVRGALPSCVCGGQMGVCGATLRECGVVTAVVADVCAACSMRRVFCGTQRLCGRAAVRWPRCVLRRSPGRG